MPIRHVPLVVKECYHVFNRGVASQAIFTSQQSYEQAVLALDYYRFDSPPIKLSGFKRLRLEDKAGLLERLKAQNTRLVEILAYVLMPNHFHFLLRQEQENGISSFVRRFANSYSRYYNIKHRRNGPLFEGVFKAVRVETEVQLIHLSRYIHLNPYVSGLVAKSELAAYPWSSLPVYLSRRASNLVSVEPVLSLVGTTGYEKFVFDHAEYAKELELVKHLIADLE